jgi:hypothetical protein
MAATVACKEKMARWAIFAKVSDFAKVKDCLPSFLIGFVRLS